MIIYFIGGEDVKRRSCFEIMKSAVNDAGVNPKVLVLLLTTEDRTKIDKYTKIIRNYFFDLGVRKIDFIYPWSTDFEISNYNLIYIPGGLPEVFLKYARKFRLFDKIKKFNGVIVGNSAGALVLCKKCIITADEDHPETKIVEELGLVNFSVEVHYKGNENLMRDLSKNVEVYAISENSTVRYDTVKKEFRFYGKVFHF